MTQFEIEVLNVFCSMEGQFGNPVGIAPYEVSDAALRQAISSALGFSETVFVQSSSEPRIAIHNPQEEITFSGHAAVGAAWYLARRMGLDGSRINGRDGLIAAWSEGDITWVRTDLATTPPWWHEYVADIEQLESLRASDMRGDEYVQFWTWIDQDLGTVRSRTFAPAWGIPEDEANGSGCMRLAACLGRGLEIRHGEGSLLFARSPRRGVAEVGGLVTLGDTRLVEVAASD